MALNPIAYLLAVTRDPIMGVAPHLPNWVGAIGFVAVADGRDGLRLHALSLAGGLLGLTERREPFEVAGPYAAMPLIEANNVGIEFPVAPPNARSFRHLAIRTASRVGGDSIEERRIVSVRAGSR